MRIIRSLKCMGVGRVTDHSRLNNEWNNDWEISLAHGGTMWTLTFIFET